MAIKRIENVWEGTGVERSPEFIGVDFAKPGSDHTVEWTSPAVQKLFDVVLENLGECCKCGREISIYERMIWNAHTDDWYCFRCVYKAPAPNTP